jgi:hypothetical protein
MKWELKDCRKVQKLVDAYIIVACQSWTTNFNGAEDKKNVFKEDRGGQRFIFIDRNK